MSLATWYVIQNSTSHVVFLDVVAQESLEKQHPWMMRLSWNHFGRKNVGYFYAIQHGAETILDFDDHNLLKDDLVCNSYNVDTLGTVLLFFTCSVWCNTGDSVI